MYANRCQIILGDKCLEITREPVVVNVSELIPWSKISGVIPIYRSSTVGYRFTTMTIVRLKIEDGNDIDIELQEVTNQTTWSTGYKSGIYNFLSDTNSYYGGHVPPLLDLHPGASVAYSPYMKLSSDQVYAITIRRDSDNDILELGFTGNYINKSLLMDFIGSSDKVYVTKVWDASGNNNHLLQPTLNLQPYVVSNGQLVTIYGKLGIAHDTGQKFTLTNPLDTNDNYTAFNVNKPITSSFTLYGSASGVPYSTLKFTDDKYYTSGESGFIASDSAYPEITPEPKYLTSIWSASEKKQRVNGVEIPSTLTPFSFNEPLTETQGDGVWQLYIIYP